MRLLILILTFIFICFEFGYSKYSVCKSGCDFPTILQALHSTTGGDTIEIKNGPNRYKENLDFSPKKNITILSSSREKDSIEGNIILGNGTNFYNLHLLFDTLKIFDMGGFSFKNCVLERGKISFCRTDFSYKSRQNSISKCQLIGVGMMREWAKQLIDRLTIDSSEIIILQSNYRAIYLGENCKLLYCRIINQYRENDIATALSFFNDSVLIENNYFNGGGNCGEFLTFQVADSVHSRNVVIRNNVFDSIDHVSLMFDGCRNGDFYNNVFINSSKQLYAFYNHQRDPGDSSFNVHMRSNTITSGRALNLTNFGKGPPSSNLTFTKNLMLSDGDINFPFSKIETDTIAHCVWGDSTSIGDGWGVKINLLTKRSNLIIGDIRYPFIKRNGGAVLDSKTGEWAGALGYLINIKKGPYKIDSSKFTIDDSISSRFWYDDPIGKDSGTTILQISRDKKNWTKNFESPLKAAGSSSSLTATGLSYKTKYYFRLIFTGTEKTRRISDTTNIDSVVCAPLRTEKGSLKKSDQLNCLIIPLFKETLIKTYLYEEGNVKISIHDIMGRKLLNYSFYAPFPGIYQHKFSNAEIRSGNTFILKIKQNNIDHIQLFRA